MEEKKISVAMCVSVNHTLPGAFLKHYMNFYLHNNEKYDLVPLCEVHYVTEFARNMMIKKILSWKNKPDYVFFIDSDMVFEPQLLDKLIEADKEIITGLYFQKFWPHYPLAWKIENQNYAWFTDFKAGEIQEIDNCGAGALLVKTSVIEKLNNPWFRFVYDEDMCPVGEDIFFCRKLQQNGFKIWLHAGTVIDHIGGLTNKRQFDLAVSLKEVESMKPTGLLPNNFVIE